MEILNEVLNNFNFKGEYKDSCIFGSGHINTTYLVTYADAEKEYKYVVQKVNSNIFKNIDGLMGNIVGVTSFLGKKISEVGGNPERETLHFIKTKSGDNYFKTENNDYYRAYVFVSDSICYDKADSEMLMKESGTAFGRFQRFLADYPAEELFETIPDFHNTKLRYDTEFMPAVENNLSGRKDTCEEQIKFVTDRKDYATRIVNLVASGDIPVRVTHNDTKLNNVLFDEESNKAICVIDLDTVMPGTALYDFGDSCRFGTNYADEDEADLSKVGINLDYFKAYADGFLSQAGKSLKKAEIDNLAFSAMLMTFECGMRFLTDYLNGDTYFRTAYPEHNLVRAKDQFALVADMEKHMDEMEAIIKELA